MVISDSNNGESIYSIILSQDIVSKLENTDRITSAFSGLSVLLVLFATPVIITLGWFLHSNLTFVFEVWTYVSVFTIIILTILSIYKMLSEEARKSKENDLAELRKDLSFLLKYRHITIPPLILSIVAGLGYIAHLFSPYFSLLLIYASVVILTLESLFHSLYKYWPKVLRNSTRLQNAFVVILIFAGLVLSVFVIGTAGVVLISVLFVGFILVGGIGLAFVVDVAASDISNWFFARTKLSTLIALAAFVFLAIWLWYSGDLVGHLGGMNAGGGVIQIANSLKGESQALLSGTNISFLSLVFALIVAAIYSAFLKIKRRFGDGQKTLLFVLLSIPIAGFVFLYLAILTDGDWIASASSIGNGFSSSLQLLPSVALFVVGYSQILIEIPRKTSRTMLTQGNRFLTALTWLIIFSALAEFLSWSVYGRPGAFVFEVDLVQWFGIPIGIALLVFKYIRKK